MSGVRHASAVHRETSEANRQELPAELADLHLRLHLGLREPHFIDRMIRAWRAMLDGTELELEFNMAVQNFVRMFPVFCVGVGCAGTDIVRNVHTAIFKVISQVAGRQAIPRFVISAELCPYKRHFLISQHNPSFLVRDNAELAETHARNQARNGETDLVPCCQAFRIGIVCKSRTPLSSSKAQNANCCQEKSAETGASWGQAESIITVQRPDSVGIECVIGLREETGELIHVHASDSQAIVASLVRLGYWTHDFTQNATEGGSLPDRTRAWWLGLLQRRKFRSAAHQQKFNDRARTFFTQMYMGFCRCVDITDPEQRASVIEEVLLLDPAERVSMAEKFGVPLLLGTGIRIPLVGPSSNLKWKTDHHLTFPEHHLPWPVSKDELSAHISIDGLTDREAELTYMIHLVFQVNGPIEFCDVNPDGERLLRPCFDWVTDGAGVSHKQIKKSPWFLRPRTLTGGTKLVTRYMWDGDYVVRCLEPTEMMLLMGWGVSEWNAAAPRDWASGLGENVHVQAELLSNMAGNAWSLYAAGPIELALLCTQGKFFCDESAEVSDVSDGEVVGVDSESDGDEWA